VASNDHISDADLEAMTLASWQAAMRFWSNPSIPSPTIVTNISGIQKLGEIGKTLQEEYAFMKYPEFQVYINAQKIASLPMDKRTALEAICKHEIGHRFNPYDTVTMLLLQHNAKKALGKKSSLSHSVVNLFCDTDINTACVKQKDMTIPQVYKTLSGLKEQSENPLWRVYMKSKELLWKQSLLPTETKMPPLEEQAAQRIAQLFTKGSLNMNNWLDDIGTYATIIGPFLTEETKGAANMLDGSTTTIEIDESEKKAVAKEIARRISKQGADGIPTNPRALEEYKEVASSIGLGAEVLADAWYYDTLANNFTVAFAKQPFSAQRKMPDQLCRWNPSDAVGSLDVQHSIQTGGILIPSLTTKRWESASESYDDQKERKPNLKILLDSSGSMPDPTKVISLPVLAGNVALKHASPYIVRVINYWDSTQSSERKCSVAKGQQVLLGYHPRGGTVFPIKEFLDDVAYDPQHCLIITDTFLSNLEATAKAIETFKRRHTKNYVTIYAITDIPDSERLKQAGATCIHDTTTNIFKHVLGEAERIYRR